MFPNTFAFASAIGVSFFFASKQELDAELARVAAKRNRRPQNEDAGEGLFYAMLTEAERVVHNLYRPLCPNGVCAIGQNPVAHPVHNGNKCNLFCIVKKENMYWSFKHKRWMLPQELQSVHLIPVDGDALDGIESSFARVC